MGSRPPHRGTSVTPAPAGPHALRRRHQTGSVLVHVAQHLLHGRAADGPLEEESLDAQRAHGAQQRQHEQQPTEARRLAGVVRPRVLAQHHLRLVLQVLHLAGVLEAARLCEGKCGISSMDLDCQTQKFTITTKK